MSVTIPFLSEAFEYINIADISTIDPCETSSCTDDNSQIKVYNYSNKTCDSGNRPFYCGTISDKEYEPVANSDTFLRFDGECGDNCFFTNSLFENSNPQKFSWYNSNETLKNCCNATKDDKFCYHNLEWGNSCNIGYTKNSSGKFRTFHDQVFLPWATGSLWGANYQQPDYCNANFGIDNLDSRWCGPSIDSDDNPDWSTAINRGGTGVYSNTSTPQHMCNTLYGRSTINNAYILGQKDSSRRYYGNVICGPLDSSLPCTNPPCDSAHDVCRSNISKVTSTGCPSKGPDNHFTFKDQCVLGKDSQTATQIPYSNIIGKNINPANGNYTPAQDFNH